MTEPLDTEASAEVTWQDGTNPALDSNDGAENPNEQLTTGDSLYDRGLQDPLDEGYSPPDYEPSQDVPTPSEEAAGLSHDKWLRAEEPDFDELAERADNADVEALEAGQERAGRLADRGDDGMQDSEKSLVAEDFGFSGGAASAEEAAMHVFDPEGSPEY